MSLSYFPIKVGDTDPPFEVVLRGPSGPSDLTGVTNVRVSYRRNPGEDPIMEVEATVVDPSNQTTADPDRGRIRHSWQEGDTEALFGDPADPTINVVWLRAEVELIRAGERVTWPTEDSIPVKVWRDIVEDGS